MPDSKKNKKPMRAALGRGLSALISSTAVPVAPFRPKPENSERKQVVGGAAIKDMPDDVFEPQTSASDEGGGARVSYLDLDAIIANPYQPRQVFDDSELKELSESIKTHGLIQPILLRRSKVTPDRYELIAGERRWRAARLAGLEKIPAIVQEIDDKEALEIALVENIQRSNLNPIEEAEAYQRLAIEFKLTQEEIAARVGKDRTSVANFMRLLKLPAEVCMMIRQNKLTMGHAKAILSVREPSAQLGLAKKCVEEMLSVRALEEIVSRVVVLDSGRAQKQSLKSHFNARFNPFPEAIDRMRHALGTKVMIRHHPSGRGKVEIEYFSEQELDRVIEQICK